MDCQKVLIREIPLSNDPTYISFVTTTPKITPILSFLTIPLDFENHNPKFKKCSDQSKL
jgi:hypothetical protein